MQEPTTTISQKPIAAQQAELNIREGLLRFSVKQFFDALILRLIITPLFAMLYSVVIIHRFGFIFRSPRVNSEVLYAAISAYLMMAIFWSFAYILTAKLNPDAFERLRPRRWYD